MTRWGRRLRGPVSPCYSGTLQPAMTRAALAALLGGLAAAALVEWVPAVTGHSYLSMHMLLEMASIVVTMLIFFVSWNSCALHPQPNALLLACAFMGVGLLDLSHTLSYAGMPDYLTANNPEKAINFWLAARYLAASSLLAVVWLPWPAPGKTLPALAWYQRWLPLGVVLLLVASLHGLFFYPPDWLPRTFIAGLGLTPCKIAAEYGVILLNALTILLLVRRLRQPPCGFDVPRLLVATQVMILSELCFTLYSSVTDLFNLLGHLYKVLAYLLLYRALFVEMIVAPYRALKDARSHAQAVLGALPDRLVELDQHGRYLQVHLPMNQHPVLGGDELLGHTVFEVLPATAARTCMQALEEARRQGYSRGHQVEIPQQEGSHWFELSVAAMHRERGEAPRFVVVSRDVTGRIQDQAALRKLQLAVEQSASAIVITDLQARIEYANQAFVRSSGYSLEEVLGQNPRILHSGQTPRATYEDLWRHLRQGQIWRGELTNRRKDGSEYIESVMISPVFDEQGNPVNYLAIKEDITRRRLDEQRIERLAHFDALTDLPNRKLFGLRCDQALAQSGRSRQPLAVLYLDLDHFKNINDSLGYQVGDAFLVEVARRLKGTLREVDILSRPSGDEFVLVLPGVDAKGAAHTAEQLRTLLLQPYQVGQHVLTVTVSIGIAIFPEDGYDFDTLSQRADMAMHRAKQDGRNSYSFFTGEMQQQSARLLALENALRQALDNRELYVSYQPQVDIRTRTLVGAEALLRWTHPQLGVISPAEFIPVAESCGLIISLGEWVLHQAASQMKQWLAMGYPPDMTMAVNLSLIQFRDPGLLELVGRVLRETGLPAHCLELELTESVTMQQPLEAIDLMHRLRGLGVRLSIDDFGTGYSSLSYLKQFEVNKLKIDQSFVRQLDRDGRDQSIVQAIVWLAGSMAITTIAEGVETREQLAQLEKLGCAEVQGYLFGKPQPAGEFEGWVRQNRLLPV